MDTQYDKYDMHVYRFICSTQSVEWQWLLIVYGRLFLTDYISHIVRHSVLWSPGQSTMFLLWQQRGNPALYIYIYIRYMRYVYILYAGDWRVSSEIGMGDDEAIPIDFLYFLRIYALWMGFFFSVCTSVCAFVYVCSSCVCVCASIVLFSISPLELSFSVFLLPLFFSSLCVHFIVFSASTHFGTEPELCGKKFACLYEMPVC